MRHGTKIARTADYFVIPAPVPCTVAAFTCACGARAFESDRTRGLPSGWSSAEDGSNRCPPCSAAAAQQPPREP